MEAHGAEALLETLITYIGFSRYEPDEHGYDKKTPSPYDAMRIISDTANPFGVPWLEKHLGNPELIKKRISDERMCKSTLDDIESGLGWFERESLKIVMVKHTDRGHEFWIYHPYSLDNVLAKGCDLRRRVAGEPEMVG